MENQIFVVIDLSVTFAVFRLGLLLNLHPQRYFLFGDLSSVKHSWHSAEVDAFQLPGVFFFFLVCVFRDLDSQCEERGIEPG